MSETFLHDINEEKSISLADATADEDLDLTLRTGGEYGVISHQCTALQSMARQLSRSLVVKRISASSLEFDDDDEEEPKSSSNTPSKLKRTSLLRSALRARNRVKDRRLSYIGSVSCPPPASDTSEIFLGTTRMNRLVKEMQSCLDDLDASAEYPLLEKWACIVYESMSSPSRTFHSVQHVFDISIEANSIQKLAAYFHDVVYYSIDGGLSEDQDALIGDLICEKDGVVSIVKGASFESNILMTMDIFGFEAGNVLDPFKGMNEFLSAALAVRCYQEALDPVYLAHIAACIEATIPFRKSNAEGKTPIECLFERMVQVNDTYDLELVDMELVKSAQMAADLGNRDLGNFATPERAVFLSNTWNLLPESNISLRNTTVFRISNFAKALQKMTGFFENLVPEDLFQSFRDDEYEAIMAKKTEAARQNIHVALNYMNCKRLSIAVVAAIAELTGGDAPLALFLGDLPERHHISTSIEDLIYCCDREPNPGVVLDRRVFELLNDGRESESNFDIKNSPLAAYIYSLIGTDGIDRCNKFAVHPMNKENALGVLKALPRECVATIVAACAEIAITRRDALDKMIKALFDEDKVEPSEVEH
jgi:hypothetical protein